MHYCNSIDELPGRSLYNSIPTTPIAPARDYLSGLEVRHTDYRHLITEYGNDPKVIYLADPPYLATNTNQYQTGWRLEDTLELLGHLNGKQVIYFTSARGDLVPILEWADVRQSNDDTTMTAQITTIERYLDDRSVAILSLCSVENSPPLKLYFSFCTIVLFVLRTIRANHKYPPREEKILRRNQMKLRRNQIISPKNLPLS